MKFCDMLKKKREELFLSTDKMAARLDVNASGYNKWERGISVPHGKSIEKICLFFGIVEKDLKQMIKESAANEIKPQPVTNMISTLKRNKEKLLNAIEGNQGAILKVKEKITVKMDKAIKEVSDLLLIEELFFD